MMEDLAILTGGKVLARDLGDSLENNTRLPYIMGHENAGWVEDVGSNVTSVTHGDTVICHPHRTCGIYLSCR